VRVSLPLGRVRAAVAWDCGALLELFDAAGEVQAVETKRAATVELTLGPAEGVEVASFEGSVAGRALGRKTGNFIRNALTDALFVWLTIDEAKRGHVWQAAHTGDVAHVVARESLEIRFVVARALGLATVHLGVGTAVHSRGPAGPATTYYANARATTDRRRLLLAAPNKAKREDENPLHEGTLCSPSLDVNSVADADTAPGPGLDPRIP